MNCSSKSVFPYRRRTGTRWVMPLGIALMLAGVCDAVWSASGPDAVPASREYSASPQDAGALPPVSGGMVLIGTILSAKPADVRAVIADARGQQRVYVLGDAISDGGTLVEIQRDYVVLSRNGQREILEFSWNAVAQLLERVTQAARNADPETPDGDYPEVLRNAMLTHPELLLQMVGATPVMDGERFSGYRVMQPEDPAFLESLGLEPGDMLTAVNGVSLNTPDYGAGLLDALSGTGRLTFTVRRGNEILVLDH
jgi:general secretion pathway protein C